MEIELETNRKFTLRILIPAVIIFSAVTITFLVLYLLKKQEGFLVGLIVFGTVYLILVVGLFSLTYKRIVKFNKTDIICSQKGKVVTINVLNIKQMTYVKMPFWFYFVAIFFFVFGENIFFFPSIEVEEQDGTKHNLGYFSKKDVAWLKDLYGDLLQTK